MNFVRASAIVVFIAIGSALIVVNAEAQLPPAAQATPAALLNPNWCSDVPASPAPPYFEHHPGEWTEARRMCTSARKADLGCAYICGDARDRWNLKKSGRLNKPDSFPSPTDNPQGPFPLSGGASGYILPAQPAPAPSGPTSDAADAVSAALSSVLPPGPFSSFPGQELYGVILQPPDVSADVSPFENAEFVNDEGLYVWQKPALPIATPMAAPTPVTSPGNFWCGSNGVNGVPLPGCVGGSETFGLFGDTQIGYDGTLGRWIATQMAANGYYAAATITSAVENGTTATITTIGGPYGLVVGDTVTIAGISVAGYNGNFVVTAIPDPGITFQYTTISGLATGTGGTAQLPSVATITSASQLNSTVTVTTTANPGLVVGAIVTIAGVNVAGYNGNFAVTAIPSGTTFQYTSLLNLGAGSGGTAQLVPQIGYLYFAASKTNKLNGKGSGWNLWSARACTTNPSFPEMDQPLLGWSGPGTSGNSAVVVDAKCFGNQDQNSAGPDNLFAIPSSSISSVSQTLPAPISAPCAAMAPARDEAGSFPNAYLLASIVPGSAVQTNAPNCAPNSSNTAAYVVEYTASASGIFGASGCAGGTSGCSPVSIGPQWGSTSAKYNLGLANQLGCNATTCEISIGDARITAAQIRPTNISGSITPVLATGFATGVAAGSSGPQSQNLWFLQNVSTGSWLDQISFSGGAQWYAYPTIAIDGDGELYLGSTQFTASSYPSTIWDSYVGIPSLTFMGQNFIEMSTGEYLGNPGQQPPQPVRWGDYNTMIYDPNANAPGSGGSWWSVEEVTCPDASNCSNGTSDESTTWVALADPSPLPYFVGYSVPVATPGGAIGENECGGGKGSICQMVYSVPPNAQFGDVLVADILTGQGSIDSTYLTLPPGWVAMPLANQSNHTYLPSSGTSDGGLTIHYATSFLAAYVYGSQPNDSGSYTFGITLRNGLAEVTGFLASYRGASTNLGAYTAYAHAAIAGDGNPNTSSFFQKVLTPPAETTLLYLFYGECFIQNEEVGENSAFSAPSGAPKITHESPLSLGTATYLAADVGVPVGGVNYGGYSTNVCTAFGGIDHAYALIIPEK
jgi:hypothetical protein